MFFANRPALYGALLSLLCILSLSFPLAAQDDEPPTPAEVLRLGRGTINALNWSPDGELLAVASSSGVWLLDAELQPLSQLNGRDFQAVAFSPDGTLLAFGSTGEDCRVIVWSLRVDERLVGRDTCADALAWSPDKNSLALINRGDQAVHLLDVTADAISRLPVPGMSAVWSPDGEQIALGVANGLFTLDAATQAVTLARVALGRSEVVAWTEAGITQICNEVDTARNVSALCAVDPADGAELATKTFIWRHPGELSEMLDVQWQARRFSFVLTNQQAGELPFLHVYDWSDDERTSFITRGNLAAWHPDETLITIAGDNGRLHTLDVTDQTVMAESLVFTAPVAAVAWSPDGVQLASLSSGDAQSVRVWDMDAHTFDALQTIPAEQTLSELDWQDDILLAGGTVTRDAMTTAALKAWSATDGTVAFDTTMVYPQAEPLVQAVSHDLQRLAQSAAEYSVTVDETLHIETAAPVVAAIAWSADDRLLATLSSTPEPDLLVVEVWDSASGERISTSVATQAVEYHPALVWDDAGTAFTIALRTRYYDAYVIQAYDALTGTRLFEYGTPQYYPPHVAWRPDAQALAIETLSEIVFVDVASGKPYLNRIPAGFIQGLDWSPDGTLLAGAHGDGTIRIWDVTGLQLAE